MLVVFFIIMDIDISSTIQLVPGKPVPHAEILDEVLTASIFNTTTDNDDTVFQYLLGNITTREDMDKLLDISILDVNNVKKIIDVAKRKFANALNEPKRRYDYEPFATEQIIVNQTLDLMRQSIYATRYKLLMTKPLRKTYKDDYSYKIAILYGSLMELRVKLERIVTNTYNVGFVTHFMWFLILYEKAVAAHVDISYIIEEIFRTHHEFELAAVAGEEAPEDEEDEYEQRPMDALNEKPPGQDK